MIKYVLSIKKAACRWIFQQSMQIMFAVWTIFYWLVTLVLLLQLLEEQDYKETLMFILSWPAVPFTFFSISLDGLFFIIIIPVFVFVFTKYWGILLNLFSHGRIGILIGIPCHLLGGLILIARCNSMDNDSTLLNLIKNGIFAALIIMLYWIGYLLLVNWKEIIAKMRRCRRMQ